MINLLKSIVTSLGGVDVSAKNHVDTYTENRMGTIKGTQIAASEHGGVWIEYQELAGYNFLNAVVVGKNDLKTFEGCELVFTGSDFVKRLISDTKEIESDYSNVSNRWITHIAFDVTDENLDFIDAKIADALQLKAKKSNEIFKILK